MRTMLLVGVALLGTASSCGYGTGSSPQSGGRCTPDATHVCAANLAFSPAVDTVAVGATVRWVNDDGVTHTATSSAVPSGAAAWDRTLAPGATDSVTLTAAGTYEYYCRFHGSPGSGMHGTIVVR